MSLYNTLFNASRIAPLLLRVLGLTIDNIVRFRDAFLTDDNLIAIYTRLGGGNRGDYQCTIQKLRSHPNYIRDEDDDFDCTYATFYFSIPKGWEWLKVFKEEFKPDEQLNSSIDFNKWKDKIKEISSMTKEEIEKQYPKIVKILNAIRSEIERRR
jgi:hypothetical protein